MYIRIWRIYYLGQNEDIERDSCQYPRYAANPPILDLFSLKTANK